MNSKETSKFIKRLGGVFYFSNLYSLGSYGVVFKGVSIYEDDLDENGARRKYAIKRVFPTINAAYTLLELRIIKLLKYFHSYNNIF